MYIIRTPSEWNWRQTFSLLPNSFFVVWSLFLCVDCLVNSRNFADCLFYWLSNIYQWSWIAVDAFTARGSLWWRLVDDDGGSCQMRHCAEVGLADTRLVCVQQNQQSKFINGFCHPRQTPNERTSETNMRTRNPKRKHGEVQIKIYDKLSAKFSLPVFFCVFVLAVALHLILFEKNFCHKANKI